MDSFIHVTGWSQHMSSHATSGRPFTPIRSLSSVAVSASTPPSPAPPKSKVPLKSPSTSQLPSFSLSTATGTTYDDEMSTLPDPRSRALSPANDPARRSASPERHPDLNDEVATLSTKLINAINHQTVLDDTLSATRQQLEGAQDRIRELEQQNASQREMMSGEVWIRRSTLETEKRAMLADKRAIQAKLAEEYNKRTETEKEKRKIEQELENLTTALFEEANRMVIGAKEEAQVQHEALQRKNDQLKAQLADSESLLKSQQEQLSELKNVMETMVIERDDLTNGTAPSSPNLARFDSKDDDATTNYGPTTPSSPLPDGMAPVPPTSMSHLVQPVLRTDLGAYDDFMSLVRLTHSLSGNRISSGSLGGLNALALGLGGSTSSAHPSNGSTSSLNIGSSAVNNSAPQSPRTSASTSSPSSLHQPGIAIPNLKETRFYKRVLAEDIEPTLRLDAAPGLSWLARRTVLSSIVDGSLVVEPVPGNPNYAAMARPQYFPCSLCGESRKDEHYLRLHRFRTSEADSAQRYPLCNYCVTRVRCTCDFLSFLRLVKDGHWRTDHDDPERGAWEESVRLRDHMFWARIGGGFVPCALSIGTDKSRRPSQQDAVSENGSQPVVEALSEPDIASRDGDVSSDSDDDAANKQPHTPPQQIEHGESTAQTTPADEVPSPVDTAFNRSSSGSEDTKRLSVNADEPAEQPVDQV